MRVQDKETRILLASVLKPVDEPRMYERMGKSLAHRGFEVFIAGMPPSSSSTVKGVQFLPHLRFKRISLSRIRVRFRILAKAVSLKPDLFIVTTHELIGIAILYKLVTGNKIIYDVQEDYWQNIMHTKAWPKVLRPLIAFSVRCKERISSPFFSMFLLAEQCYQEELHFARGKSIVIANKCALAPSFERKSANVSIGLIFTGTMAESTGIFEAINLAKKLRQLEPRIQLTIVGQCPQQNTLRKIISEISESPYIHLIGGNDFVPHEKIADAIFSAHFGIISYPPSPHTKDKIPSKLYEYLACQLPVLLQENKLWGHLCASSNAAISVDFQKPDAVAILIEMHRRVFYSKTPENVTWQSEEPLLLTSIRSLL
ncbi:MAG TPA: glycosyltransferase [Cyclobacteriaceae bacterium]|nr:glycosyltransferase [Cyclobacteriaceae bacterium]